MTKGNRRRKWDSNPGSLAGSRACALISLQMFHLSRDSSPLLHWGTGNRNLLEGSQHLVSRALGSKEAENLKPPRALFAPAPPRFKVPKPSLPLIQLKRTCLWLAALYLVCGKKNVRITQRPLRPLNQRHPIKLLSSIQLNAAAAAGVRWLRAAGRWGGQGLLGRGETWFPLAGSLHSIWSVGRKKAQRSTFALCHACCIAFSYLSNFTRYA